MLDRRDRHEAAVRALVGLVVGRAGVQRVGAARPVVQAAAEQAVERRHQHGDAVDHRRIDDLPLARALRLDQRAGDAPGQEHRAAGVVAEKVQRRRRRRALPADRVQRAGKRDVVHVVAGRLRERPVLAETGHPPVDELRVQRQAFVRAEAQPLHRAGPEALDKHVGLRDQLAGQRDPLGVLEVDRERTLAAIGQVEVIRSRHAQVRLLEPVEPQHLGAHVRQQHPAHRRRPDAGELDDPDAGQRPLLRHLTDSLVSNWSFMHEPDARPSSGMRTSMSRTLTSPARSTTRARAAPARAPRGTAARRSRSAAARARRGRSVSGRPRPTRWPPGRHRCG